MQGLQPLHFCDIYMKLQLLLELGTFSQCRV